MQSHTDHLSPAPSNMKPSASEIKEKLYKFCQLSLKTSPKIFNEMALEISVLAQQPHAQYSTDALSQGDLSPDPSMSKLEMAKTSSPNILELDLFKNDDQIIHQILTMALRMHQYSQRYMAIIDPLAAVQHIITFQLPSSANNGYQKKEDDDNDSKDDYDDDIHQYPTPTQSISVTTRVLKDSHPFEQYQSGHPKYKQRECRFHHIVVDLEKNMYHEYDVTSIIAPYGVVEGKQRGYLLVKAADLYPTINNSIQLLYTSMMGMVYLDAVVTDNDGYKSNKRLMSITDVVSFVLAGFGLPQEQQNNYRLKAEAEWHLFGVKMQTDWEYIKYIAAMHGNLVSDGFKELVLDAVVDHDSDCKPPSLPYPDSFIQVPLSYHIKQDDIYDLLQMIGISSEGIDVDSDNKDNIEEGKEDGDMVQNENINHNAPADEPDIEAMLALLDEMQAQNGTILNRLNQWQSFQKNDEQDPYMQPYDFPEEEQVMKNE